MTGTTLLLYLSVALIWGSTWIAITFQLGQVNPLISVIYRFALAAGLLFGWCWYRGYPLRLSLRQHHVLVLQGSFLFGFNYWLMYLAAQHVTSGLIAVIFSTIVFFNAFNGRLWLRMPIRPTVLLGGVVGLAGVMLLFSNELDALTLQDSAALGLGLALLSTLLASLGNIAAAHNTASGTSIMVINAWAMAYGTLALVATALLLGIPFTMNFSFSYLTALLYLTIPGSIITFAGYLRLIHLLGADKAAYMSMLVPVIALLISSLFEGYQWTLLAVLGLALILCGNWLALRRKGG